MGITPKALRRGTHRSASINETLNRVLRLAPVMGITRVANVTGLDSVGVPVVMVCRPNSRSVAVSQGKGIDLASARASGLMEAAELYHAETITLPLRLAAYEDLRYQYGVVETDDLPRRVDSRFHPLLRLLWCEGRDLMSGANLLVPYELVHTDYTMPLPDGHGCFSASSNGLASGNTLIEAISQGICEVIERHATAQWKYARALEEDRLDLTSIDDPIPREIIEKFESAGLLVAIWDITTDIRIAAFACLIIPRSERAWHFAAAAGYGCHPARQIALLRALTEAAQTRLTVISGLRDDFRGDTYEQLQDIDVLRSIRDCVTVSRPIRRFSDAPNFDVETFEEDVEWELQCLRSAGIRRVIAVDLTKPAFDLPVVRIIIPGLAPTLKSSCVPKSAEQTAIAAML
jgi:ribosomal protein S12 methylthiotransferase accessory factor